MNGKIKHWQPGRNGQSSVKHVLFYFVQFAFFFCGCWMLLSPLLMISFVLHLNKSPSGAKRLYFMILLLIPNRWTRSGMEIQHMWHTGVFSFKIKLDNYFTSKQCVQKCYCLRIARAIYSICHWLESMSASKAFLEKFNFTLLDSKRSS